MKNARIPHTPSQLIPWGFVALLLTAFLSTSSNAQEDMFRSLFDGTTLNGWSGDPAHWKVINGIIVGSTKPKGLNRNTFLIAKGNYQHFILRVRFKLTDGASGIQFRSRPIGRPDEFLVTGYQADIGGGDTGTFYEEKGRGTLVAAKPSIIAASYRKDDWNAYEIKMLGDTGEIRLNGQLASRFTETDPRTPRTGVIALQLQAGSGMEIAFKEIEILELPPPHEDKTAPNP